MWRLVLERRATLAELETIWSLDDVARANALLDMEHDVAKRAQQTEGRSR